MNCYVLDLLLLLQNVLNLGHCLLVVLFAIPLISIPVLTMRFFFHDKFFPDINLAFCVTKVGKEVKLLSAVIGCLGIIYILLIYE